MRHNAELRAVASLCKTLRPNAVFIVDRSIRSLPLAVLHWAHSYCGQLIQSGTVTLASAGTVHWNEKWKIDGKDAQG